MKPLDTIPLLLLALPALSVADARSELQAEYNTLAASFGKQDIKTYDNVLASDYILHVGATTHDRAYVIKDFKHEMSLMKNVKWVRTVTKVTQSNGITVARVRSIFDGDFDMGGKTAHFWNSAISDDSWIQTPAKHWQLRSSNLVTLDAKLDGKPAGHFPTSGGKGPG